MADLDEHATDEPQLFRELVTSLRAEKGLTLEDLAFEARRRAPERSAVSLSLIQKRLAPGGSGPPPSIAMMEAIAGALGISPAAFVEYRLALARRQLDEGHVGVEDALAAYERVQALLNLDEAIAEAERHFGPSAPADAE